MFGFDVRIEAGLVEEDAGTVRALVGLDVVVHVDVVLVQFPHVEPLAAHAALELGFVQVHAVPVSTQTAVGGEGSLAELAQKNSGTGLDSCFLSRERTAPSGMLEVRGRIG